jgi:uncharacterized protein YdeI (BOF family)
MLRRRGLKIRQTFSALQIITLLTFTFAGFPAAVYSAPPGPKTIPIAQARSLPLGTVVTIDGFVTVASGTFSSSTFDQGFAIQDNTGGIYVSVSVNHSLSPRQQVRVTGTLADNVLPGLLVLTDVTSIKVQGRGPRVQAVAVATGDVSEATEGTLVRITGTITQPIVNDLPFGFIIVTNDGSGEINVFVCASTGIDVSGLSPGQTIEVTGFSGQFAERFEVDPRTQDDIRVVTN